MKKITTEPDDQPTEADDHGVLADAGLDTTAIGIMGPQTAQVRVLLPQVLEEPDDEVVDDELEPGDLRSGEIVIELPAEQVDEVAEAVAEARETGEDPAITGEIVDDVVDAVREHLAENDESVADDEVIDVVVIPEQDAPQDDADEADDADENGDLYGDDEGDEREELLAEDALVEEEPIAAAQDAREAAEPEFVEDVPAAEPTVAPEVAEDETVEEQPVEPAKPVDSWRMAAAELAAEHAKTAPAAEPQDSPDEDESEEDESEQDEIDGGPVEDELDTPSDAPAAETEIDAEVDAEHPADVEQGEDEGDAPAPSAVDKAKSYARIWAEESAVARGASTDLETTSTQQTTGAMTMTARRLEDLGKNAERESSDLLTADRVLNPHRTSRPVPEGAWSEFVYGLTGGRLNLGDSRKVRARKALEARVAAPLSGETRFVPVLSRKGGVGKTTVTTLLGMALADGREDRVIAIDANPDRGTLADRIGKRTDKTVRDLVHKAGEIRGFNDISRFVARDETRLDVLASDPDPRIAEAFGEDDYRRVADVAEHFYSLVLTDTGTGIIHSVMGATLTHADQLIIVTGLNLDEVRLASETITWLESNGYEELARNAIVVLNQQSEGTPMVRLSELETHFGSRVRSVVHLPYDRALATGAAIVYRELQPATREAARDLAARVVDGLREGRSA
ncbi:MinD/ParA family ATP-binding protein [Microbacterium paludicola]|uniref:MinD/ParA family ATP-binding protein n=1 Tax=Microbacterium paludicola TaxID=300019 RepID=UPI0031DAA287